jgi:hypothetical protein
MTPTMSGFSVTKRSIPPWAHRSYCMDWLRAW